MAKKLYKLTRKQFMEALAKYPGVTLDEESNPIALNLDSPVGKLFCANSCHNLMEPYSNNCGQSWKQEAYAEMAIRLAYGLYECTDPECDVCQPALAGKAEADERDAKGGK